MYFLWLIFMNHFMQSAVQLQDPGKEGKNRRREGNNYNNDLLEFFFFFCENIEGIYDKFNGLALSEEPLKTFHKKNTFWFWENVLMGTYRFFSLLSGDTGQPACFSVFMPCCSLVLSGEQEGPAKALSFCLYLTTQWSSPWLLGSFLFNLLSFPKKCLF